MAVKKSTGGMRAPSKGTPAKSKTTKRKKGGAGKVGVTILVSLLAAALVVIGVGAAYVATDGFGTQKQSAFIVQSGGATYTKDAGGVQLYTGMEFAVECLADETEYEVTVAAKGTQENDFEFQLGEEKGFRWLNQNGKDYTAGLTITKAEAGFKVEYEDLKQIITKAKGTAATLLSESASGDLFKLAVTCGNSRIELGFSLYYVVDGVEIPPSVIFPNPEQPDEGEKPPEGQEPEQPDNPNEGEQDTLEGKYTFYSMTDGETTYHVGETIQPSILPFTFTEDYMVVELRADGKGTMTLDNSITEPTLEEFSWEADANDSNRILMKNPDGTGAPLIMVKIGKMIYLTLNDVQYTLQKQI